MRAVASYLLAVIACIYGKQFRCDYTHVASAGGWIKYHPAPADWNEARDMCHLEGAILASPLNEGLQKALLSLLPRNQVGVITGISAQVYRGMYYSLEGIPLGDIPHIWANNEPTYYEDENCLLMTLGGVLADVRCNDTYPYFCYKNSTGIPDLNKYCGTIDKEYALDNRTGSCYKFHRVPKLWSRANVTCTAEGGHLAIINSDTEAQILQDIYNKNYKLGIPGNFYKEVAFIGFHYYSKDTKWLTVDGKSLEEAGFAKWSPGEPNNMQSTASTAKGQFCGGFTRTARLDDVYCSGGYEDTLVFFCEKRPDSLLCKTSNKMNN